MHCLWPKLKILKIIITKESSWRLHWSRRHGHMCRKEKIDGSRDSRVPSPASVRELNAIESKIAYPTNRSSTLLGSFIISHLEVRLHRSSYELDLYNISHRILTLSKCGYLCFLCSRALCKVTQCSIERMRRFNSWWRCEWWWWCAYLCCEGAMGHSPFAIIAIILLWSTLSCSK